MVIVAAIGGLMGSAPAMALLLLFVACASPQGAGGSGAECYRIEDCREGLVCVKNACTDKLTGIVGMAPMGTAAAGGAKAVVEAGASVEGGAGQGGAGAAGAGGTPGAGGVATGTGGALGSGGAPGSGGSGGTPTLPDGG